MHGQPSVHASIVLGFGVVFYSPFFWTSWGQTAWQGFVYMIKRQGYVVRTQAATYWFASAVAVNRWEELFAISANFTQFILSFRNRKGVRSLPTCQLKDVDWWVGTLGIEPRTPKTFCQTTLIEWPSTLILQVSRGLLLWHMELLPL
jgi:hypothetical protein